MKFTELTEKNQRVATAIRKYHKELITSDEAAGLLVEFISNVKEAAANQQEKIDWIDYAPSLEIFDLYTMMYKITNIDPTTKRSTGLIKLRKI